MYEVTEEEKTFENLLQTIPMTASITSSPEIRPHVTHRMHSYTVPYATTSAEYIALIDQNRLVGNINPKDFENRLIEQLKTNEEYQLVQHINHFYLYKRMTPEID